MRDIAQGFCGAAGERWPDAVIYAEYGEAHPFLECRRTRLFGDGEHEALGASLDLISPDRLRGPPLAGYGEVMRDRETRYAERALLAVPALHKDGRQLSVEFTIQPFRNASGGTSASPRSCATSLPSLKLIHSLPRELLG